MLKLHLSDVRSLPGMRCVGDWQEQLVKKYEPYTKTDQYDARYTR